MNKLTIPTKLIEDHLVDSEVRSAAFYFFIYRYVLSNNHLAINFIELARRLKINVPIHDDNEYYEELADEDNEEVRYQTIQSWTHNDTFRNKLKISVEYIFSNASEERSNLEQHQISSFFRVVSSLIENGLSIKELLMFFKTRFSDVIFRVNADTFVTPSNLISELISFQNLNSTTRSVLDPACKSGDFLLAALHNTDLNQVFIHGIESDPSAGLVAEAMLRTEDVNHNNFILSNSVESIIGRLSVDKKFDLVICNPPFGRLPDSKSTDDMHYELGIDRHTKAEVAYLKLGLSKLTSKGRAVFVLPSIIMESGRYLELRKELIEKHGLHAVILLPNDIFQHARVSTCLLMFSKENTHNAICFVDSNELAEKKTGQDPFSAKSISEIVSFVRDKPKLVDGLTRTVMKDDIEEESKLNPRNYLKVSKANSLLNQYECLRENHIKQFSELEDLQREFDKLAKGEIHER